VINATGVIVHTNLVRAPLSDDALAAIDAIGGGYASLEYDLDAGERGSRFIHASDLVRRLTGAEDALVVNNNAAGVLLMLSALCQGREVVISRSQLVEIGGGFRVPDVMIQSGARLAEVGTTNRTHLSDYAAAIGEETGALLVAHHSNFKIVGFTSEPSLAELAELGHERDIPLLYDQGSGALLDTSLYGLDAEPTVQDALAAGVDVVAFSADKLLGGPQAGILCGRRESIERMRRHPLARALRPDKLCLAALAATLRHYVVHEAESKTPVWRMIAVPLAELQETAQSWVEQLRAADVLASVIDGTSAVGGGSLPGSTLPTKLVAIDHPEVDTLAARLRRERPAVIARIQENRLVVDPRTVLERQADALLEILSRLAPVGKGD
jgi:L-seryl-tRNA(Ser) seleniumtransferase